MPGPELICDILLLVQNRLRNLFTVVAFVVVLVGLTKGGLSLLERIRGTRDQALKRRSKLTTYVAQALGEQTTRSVLVLYRVALTISAIYALLLTCIGLIKVLTDDTSFDAQCVGTARFSQEVSFPGSNSEFSQVSFRRSFRAPAWFRVVPPAQWRRVLLSNAESPALKQGIVGTANERTGNAGFHPLEVKDGRIEFSIAPDWNLFESEYVLTNPILPLSETEETEDEKNHCTGSALVFGYQVPKHFRFEESLVLVFSAAECRERVLPWGQNQGPMVTARKCEASGRKANTDSWKECREGHHADASETITVTNKDTCAWWVFSPEPLKEDTDIALEFCMRDSAKTAVQAGPPEPPSPTLPSGTFVPAVGHRTVP